MSIELLTETALPVRCLDCDHQWAPKMFLPMEARKFARVLRGHANCPRCGASCKRVVFDMAATQGAQGIVTRMDGDGLPAPDSRARGPENDTPNG
jgi:hypothetical protein